MLVKFHDGEIREVELDINNPDPSLMKDIMEVYVIKQVLRPAYALKPVSLPVVTEAKGAPKDTPKGAPKGVPNDVPKDVPKGIPKDIPKDIPQAPNKKGPKK